MNNILEEKLNKVKQEELSAVEEEIRKENEETTGRVVTLPNLLSLIRLLMIPVIVWFYIKQQDYIMTLILVALSLLTDIVDGWIARSFHSISRVGKILDPAADKLTQAAVLFCLVTRFPHMIYPLVFIFVKELTMLWLGYIMYRKTNVIVGAKWYGKLTTGLLYGTFALHLGWINIPPVVSDVLIILCMVMMAFAFMMYVLRIFAIMKEEGKKE